MWAKMNLRESNRMRSCSRPYSDCFIEDLAKRTHFSGGHSTKLGGHRKKKEGKKKVVNKNKIENEKEEILQLRETECQ